MSVHLVCKQQEPCLCEACSSLFLFQGEVTWEIKSPQILLGRSWFDLVRSACSVGDTVAGVSEGVAVIYTCPHTP